MDKDPGLQSTKYLLPKFPVSIAGCKLIHPTNSQPYHCSILFDSLPLSNHILPLPHPSRPLSDILFLLTSGGFHSLRLSLSLVLAPPTFPVARHSLSGSMPRSLSSASDSPNASFWAPSQKASLSSTWKFFCLEALQPQFSYSGKWLPDWICTFIYLLGAIKTLAHTGPARLNYS